MPKIVKVKAYTFKELSDQAKDKARDWYREGFDYDWWDSVYQSATEAGAYLGFDLEQKPVKLMGGGTRYDPSIWFAGFYHQGQGSAFDGTWRARDVKAAELKADFTSDTELHRLADEAHRLAQAFPHALMNIKAHRDTSIDTSIEFPDDEIDGLEYKSPEYEARQALLTEAEEALTELANDFNSWIFKLLREEYEYLNSDEQVDESIIANEYLFTKDGQRSTIL